MLKGADTKQIKKHSKIAKGKNSYKIYLKKPHISINQVKIEFIERKEHMSSSSAFPCRRIEFSYYTFSCHVRLLSCIFIEGNMGFMP